MLPGPWALHRRHERGLSRRVERAPETRGIEARTSCLQIADPNRVDLHRAPSEVPEWPAVPIIGPCYWFDRGTVKLARVWPCSLSPRSAETHALAGAAGRMAERPMPAATAPKSTTSGAWVRIAASRPRGASVPRSGGGEQRNQSRDVRRHPFAVLLEAGDRRVGLNDGQGRGLVIDRLVDRIMKAFRSALIE